MSKSNDETWLFLVEWFDPMPRIRKQYLLKFFIKQHQVEMVDLKSKKLFLKKSPCPPELSANDFFIGAKVLLYCRELDIIDYADRTTETQLNIASQQSTLVLSPETYLNWGNIIDSVYSNDLSLVKIKSVQMTKKLADNVCDALNIDLRQSSSLSSGISCIVTFQGLDGISKMNQLADNFSSPKNGAVFACNNSNQVSDIDNLIFSRNVPNSATLDNCTCCVIRPHAVKSKNLGKILSIITEQGYEISAIKSLYFDRPQSEEFLEVYHGVLPDVSDHVIQLCSGLCVALEIRAEDAVNTFRKTVGPWDVEIAKELRSESLRGKFGEDKVRSAIHCTDLDVDGVSECEYCFKILS